MPRWPAAGPRRAGWFVAALLLVVGAAALVVLRPEPGSTGGVPVAAETIVGRAGSSGAQGVLAIRRVGAGTATSTADDESVAAVLEDVNAFWTATLPADFGRAFVPLAGGYVSIDSTTGTGSAPCVSSPDQIAGNAYYCPNGDAIVYDSAGLIPVLLGHYGVAGLASSFAHEFGHAIQARIGPTAADRGAGPSLYPSILIEAQGDCFSGAFLSWAVAGHSAHVRLPASSMVRAVAPLLDFRDPVEVTAGDPTAHGLGLDRLTSILLGYRRGAGACHSLTRAEMNPTLGRSGLVRTPAPDRFPSTAAAIAAARSSIGTFVSDLPQPPAGASSLTAAATPSTADLTAAAPYGQFADAAALALAVGRAVTGSAVGAACFTGAWTGSVLGRAGAGQLGSWAGDADEALDMLRARPSASFDELAGYADGFATGWAACP